MKTKKSTKRALLGSVAIIALCLVMLMGTTFAWFTDTASTGVNTIESGTLGIRFVGAFNDQNQLSFTDYKNNTNILWEPGATFKTGEFQVENTGNLALKYKLTLDKENVTGDTKLLDAIEFSVVNANGDAVDLDTFEGHLNGKDGGKISEKLYIQGYMKETAGNEFQGMTLNGIGIHAYATQDTVEYDSNSDQYDANAQYQIPVSDVASMTAAIAEGQGVVLQNDITIADTLTVPENGNVAIDLNGNTLTDTTANGPEVEGTLVIEDTTGTGKLVLAGSKASINVEAGATLVMNSGVVEGRSGYAVYCINGSKAVINGGTVTSKYAPLTGNNTTGNMNFEINGGTLTAEQGPAIYMPGQGDLTITGGVLNGGISLRMGQVNISGGVINAATSNIDGPAEYYDYSGNAWLPDALYVFGGTYNSKDATYGNSLNLNITGGTFNCTNGQGSAIAIYDLGKVEQTMNVTVSSSVKATTNAASRKAVQVLSLTDIGVTSPKAGYGFYSGNVAIK